MNLSKKLVAEALGTFWLVLAATGSAMITAGFPELGIGFGGVALAVGLAVMSGAYALGHISGAHFNPAVTVGLAVAQRFAPRQAVPYIAAQLAGAIAASGVVVLIASGQPGFEMAASSAVANGYGAHSPSQFSLLSAFVVEAVLSMVLVMVILGVTDRRAASGFAPIAIGFCLCAIHLVSIPVTNTSVNPARSTSAALFAGDWAISQLWLFWVAPITGAVVAGLIYPLLERPATKASV